MRQGCLILLISLCAFVVGCWNFGSLEGSKPVPLATNQPQPDPFIYGTGERLLVFGAVGGNVLDVNRTTGPIVDYLGHRLNVRFRLAYFRRYPDIIDAMVKGKTDFAWLGPTTYLAIRENTPCVPLAQVLRDGVGYYEGVILARVEDGFTSVKELKGRRFAFIDRRSTSGFIYPTYYLQQQGIDGSTFFGAVEYAGGHSNALLRLVNGRYDAVCTERDILKRLGAKVDTSRLHVLAVTGRIPNGPIAAHPNVGSELQKRARKILTSMAADPEGNKLLVDLRKGSNFSGFGPVSEAVYDEVKKVLMTVGTGGK